MKISRKSPSDSQIVHTKFHENRLRIDAEIVEKHAIQVNLTAGIDLVKLQVDYIITCTLTTKKVKMTKLELEVTKHQNNKKSQKLKIISDSPNVIAISNKQKTKTTRADLSATDTERGCL